MSKKDLRASEARVALKKYFIKPNTTLGIVITHVSSSGMSRTMRVMVGKDMQDVTGYVADLLGYSMTDRGIRVSGCGMDMTLWLALAITDGLYGKRKPKGLKGNGGSCLQWRAIF